MGKRNYAKVPKYRRKRPRLLEVGEFFRNASTSLPLVPTEHIPVGVPVSPSDASPSSARDNGKEQETKPHSVVHNNNNDEKDQVLAVEVILDDDNDDEVEEAKILGDSDKQKQQSLLHVF